MNLAITADWHIPLVDDRIVKRFIEDAKEHKVKDCCIIGDWFNFDHFGRFDPKQGNAGVEDELEVSNHYMALLTDNFRNVIFTKGNHDERLLRTLGYKVEFETAMKMAFHLLSDRQKRKLEVRSDDFLWHTAGGARWFLAHPQEYSRTPLRVPRELAAIYHTNVGTGHSHHTAVGYDRSGDLTCFELGGFFDRAAFEYTKRTTTFPKWQPGYSFLLDSGKLIVESAAWTLRDS